MTIAPSRAWRFNHPDFDSGEAGLALSPTGAIALLEDGAAIRQALLLLLSTARGERVMRPEYGCDLGRLIYWPNDATTAGLAIHYLREAIGRWEPRVELLAIDAGADPSAPGRLDISIEYRVRRTHVTDRLTYSVLLSGGDVT